MSSSRFHPLRHGRRILREGEALQTSAASILVDVGQTANADRPTGVAELIEQARVEGRAEGYQAAMEEMAAAEATGRSAQLRRVADALVAAAGQVAETRSQKVAMGGAEAAELAYELSRAYLQRELSVGRPAIEAVARALALVPDGHDLIVRLNPGDAIAPAELTDMVANAAVKVVVDPRVERGGCVVVAGPCRVDTQLGAALDRARRVLAEVYPHDDDDGGGGGEDTRADITIVNGAPTGAEPLPLTVESVA